MFPLFIVRASARRALYALRLWRFSPLLTSRRTGILTTEQSLTTEWHTLVSFSVAARALCNMPHAVAPIYILCQPTCSVHEASSDPCSVFCADSSSGLPISHAPLPCSLHRSRRGRPPYPGGSVARDRCLFLCPGRFFLLPIPVSFCVGLENILPDDFCCFSA